ncbi:MAG: sugar-binding protein [Armatimonadota bacterium]
MRHRFLLVILLVAALPAWAAQPASVSYYECLRCAQPPVIDGNLDDPCWQKLPQMDQFFKYWTPTPELPPLQTAARLCYDDRGLYLGITMYKDQLDKIKATVDSRDNPLTWMDDCVEVMVDPANGGTGYYKFCTNYNAARYDERATNMVLDSGWNVEGWQVKTARAKGGWAIEFFFPWADLEHRPAPGDIWSFALVRYGWASGGFKGVSWSLGGAGAHPAQFGYLGFGPFSEQTLPRLARAAVTTKGQSLRLLRPELVLTCERGQWQREDLRRWLRGTLRAVDADLEAVRAALLTLTVGADRDRLQDGLEQQMTKLNELRAQAGGAQVPTVTAALIDHEALLLRQRASDLRYEALLLGLVARS